ncbi:MAG TPA: CYTH and CHAD domain-containing protein [Actinocrinis sp.]|jgi:CHAD domain-containing protein
MASMATEHRETERKYESGSPVLRLPPLTALPKVASVSDPRQERLRAEYYDTDDLRLIRAGITLRRRRGGSDEGWHLKLPAGADARRELWQPLGSPESEIPAELAGLVLAYSRGEPLRPVAHITTIRHRRILSDDAGVSLAEIVADDVSAQSLGRATTISTWQEAEFELTAGDTGLLEAADKLLQRGGLHRAGHAAKLERVLADRLPPAVSADRLTRKSATAEVVLAYLRDQADTMKSFDVLVRRGEPDSVHRMRVAARRLRSTLQSFGTIVGKAETRHLRDELRWLGRVLGEVRDGEILAGRVEDRLRQVPAELVMGSAAARVQVHFAPLRAAAGRAVLDALDSGRYLALLDELDRLLGDPPLAAAAGQPVGDELPAAAGRAYRRARRRMRHARRAAPGAGREIALHETRKAVKRARYAAEVLRPVSGSRAKRSVKQMKKLQSVLGEHQDVVIARGCMRELAVRAFLAGENPFVYGLMYEREDARLRELQERAARTWKHTSAAWQ